MQEKQRIEHKLSYKLSDNTRNRISNWALYHALDQHRKVIYAQIEGAEPLGPCSGAFEKTLGIPCRHTIAARLLLNQPLAMDDFIKQWVLQHPAKPSTSTSIIAKHLLRGLCCYGRASWSWLLSGWKFGFNDDSTQQFIMIPCWVVSTEFGAIYSLQLICRIKSSCPRSCL